MARSQGGHVSRGDSLTGISVPLQLHCGRTKVGQSYQNISRDIFVCGQNSYKAKDSSVFLRF
jgi:hypothetical protein